MVHVGVAGIFVAVAHDVDARAVVRVGAFVVGVQVAVGAHVAVVGVHVVVVAVVAVLEDELVSMAGGKLDALAVMVGRTLDAGHDAGDSASFVEHAPFPFPFPFLLALYGLFLVVLGSFVGLVLV